ncbi:MAG: hypothetical protein PHG60_00910 [Candidatus Dojkabacteria bacterium]|jgi:regulatory protein YycI of two-component signal transduction system YycFG|nr:hypothetical protein [Candidatus Dojkabacteria bacterium]
MKKFLIATILIVGLSTVPIYAQEDTVKENTQMEIQVEQESTEEPITLSEELKIQKTEGFSFITILFAILTPALLVIIAYLLIKMSNK